MAEHSSYIHPPSSANRLGGHYLTGRLTNSSLQRQMKVHAKKATPLYHLRNKVQNWPHPDAGRRIQTLFSPTARCLHSTVDDHHLINTKFERGKELSCLFGGWFYLVFLYTVRPTNASYACACECTFPKRL